MKITSSIAAMTAALVALLSSCTQMQPCGTETVPDARVVLEKKNYRVLATRVRGEDAGFSLFPGAAALTRICTMIPGVSAADVPSGILLDAPSESRALDNLYRASGACHTGRATALINVRKEVGGWNAIIIGRPRVRYTADLIEFIPQSSATPSERASSRR